ncbi:conserved hypothetical protein [Archaeoglobus fulgidus DSM 4304]|uniref:Uncharacterized protein AF_1962 n=1 Tax=Archaeoglobus fulgidus (strain ATCC 49558 / DSM 4304 / JCM 9628 / NBRC 100126 / VC-16) TaxID=224325 RepID=Y1962_ARCFU|nr:RecName: Full=Uncharacterized protein AF_1962 [Archaeoglobus fulgidus DSM 4304]AAB89291.1 conserved hypothetical protein [Archaeoglobus fulgidus DSM 4304]
MPAKQAESDGLADRCKLRCRRSWGKCGLKLLHLLQPDPFNSCSVVDGIGADYLPPAVGSVKGVEDSETVVSDVYSRFERPLIVYSADRHNAREYLHDVETVSFGNESRWENNISFPTHHSFQSPQAASFRLSANPLQIPQTSFIIRF